MDIIPRATALREAVEKPGKANQHPKQVLTVEQVAEYFQISRTKVFDLIKKEKLRAFKIDGLTRISRRAISRYTDQQEAEARK